MKYLVKTTLQLVDLTADAFEDGIEDVRQAVADAARVAVDAVSVVLSFSVDVEISNGTLSVDASINTNNERAVSRTVGKNGFLNDVNKGLSKAKNYLVSLAQAIHKTEPLIVQLWDDATGDVVPADDVVPEDDAQTTEPASSTAKYLVQTTLNFTQMTEDVFADSYDALKDVVAAALDVLDTDVSEHQRGCLRRQLLVECGRE